jgi:thiol-disulfide isomerase/thioredoxin
MAKKAPPKAPTRAKEVVEEDPEVPGAVRVPWVEDDWKAASAQSKAQNKPVFADMWAPWCHTCLSMQTTVFIDPSLAPYVERFVWLAADTDKEINADLMGLVDMNMWPTFFVLDGDDGSVQGSFAGGASIAQIRDFLDDSEAAYLDAHGKSLAEGDPRRPLREGARALREKRYADADAAYDKALNMAKPDWSRRPDVLVDQIRSRYKGQDWKGCFKLAKAKIAEVAPAKAASVTDFSYYARRCAEHVDDKKAKALRETLRKTLTELEGASEAALSIDDRSDLLANLRELHLADADEAAAKASAEKQRDLLAKAFNEAKSPRIAMTYNWPRAEVHVYLGEGEALLPDLQKSVRDLPEEYDPPYRLAWVLHQLERDRDALGFAQKATKLAYGPRKAHVLSLLSDIQAAIGDARGSKTSLQSALKLLQTLPATQRNDDAIAAMRERVANAG